ncbi:MAG: hypothetical protein PSX36_08835 [bacterium]|nr:hypothetical protein [bacterium]
MKFANQRNFLRNETELYSPNLATINSVPELVSFADKLALERGVDLKTDTAAYVQLCSELVEKRFRFGTATYEISDNWIAFFMGKLFWHHFEAIVDPNDILKHSEGLCSQQTIVFLNLLKNKGISFRTVGLGFKEGPGHFLSEVKYTNSWNLYDVSIEPKWAAIYSKNRSLEFYLKNKDLLYLVYEGKISKESFALLLRKVEYGKPNTLPAKNMLLFHHLTHSLTFIFPVLLSWLFFLSISKSRRKKKIEALKVTPLTKINSF